jgi:hypothetical protein
MDDIISCINSMYLCLHMQFHDDVVSVRVLGVGNTLPTSTQEHRDVETYKIVHFIKGLFCDTFPDWLK